MSRETRQEQERGYARERGLDETQPQRARPRLGGSSPLPASGAAAELFTVSIDDLTREERAGAGWCVRLGVPDPIPATGDYDLHELIAELTVMVAGTAYAIEINAFPGALVHLVGEQISARVKWGIAPASVPPDTAIRWQLARGSCETRAVRAFTFDAAPSVGLVPIFATGFAIYTGELDPLEDIQLEFVTHEGSTRVLQHYSREDLLQVVGAFAPLPPGASAWRWLTATAADVRIAFTLGDQE